MRTAKQILLWFALAFSCFLPATALTQTAPENRVWEIFSTGYDAATAEVTDLGSRTAASTLNYDTAPIHGLANEEIPTKANRALFGQIPEFKAAEGIVPTSENLITISQHLSTVEAEGPEFAMYSRLTTAFENGETLTGADAAFYQHELIESSLVDSGMEQGAAHVETLNIQGISNYGQLYDSSVIQQFPTSFNAAARAAAGVH